MSNADELIGLTQAAREFSVPPEWLRAEADARRLPHAQARGRVLFSREALRHALLERAHQQINDREVRHGE